MSADVLILTVALIILSVVLAAIGIAGLSAKLPKNPVMGVRVKSVQASEDAWEAGHRAAGISLILAAIPPAVVAGAMVLNPPAEIQDWILVYALAGVITGGLIALSVKQADRAAREVS
jgi:uncharacterized membrane protein